MSGATFTKDMPKVSVIMSLYNSEKYLRKAIDSVLSQTFTDFEFIIIDDGSQDNGAGIVQTYSDPRISLIFQRNTGLPSALNNAIEVAKGDLIARMDPDDICLPNRFARQFDYLLHHQDVSIVGSAAICIDESGKELGHIRMTPFHALGESVSPESPCIHPSVMFRRSVFNSAGGYPGEMRYGGEDAILFNRILPFGSIANLSDPLIYYRLSKTSMSQKSRKFNHLLRKIISKKIIDRTVSSSDLNRLAKEYRCSKGESFGYYLYIGKLLLAGDDGENESRLYLFKALKNYPLSLHCWLVFVSSFLPAGFREKLLRYWKNI